MTSDDMREEKEIRAELAAVEAEMWERSPEIRALTWGSKTPEQYFTLKDAIWAAYPDLKARRGYYLNTSFWRCARNSHVRLKTVSTVSMSDRPILVAPAAATAAVEARPGPAGPDRGRDPGAAPRRPRPPVEPGRSSCVRGQGAEVS